MARDAMLQAIGRRSDFGRVGSAVPSESDLARKATGGATARPPAEKPVATTTAGRPAPPRSAAPRAKVIERLGAAQRQSLQADERRFWYDPARDRVLNRPPAALEGEPDARAVADLEIMLEKAELREAAFVLRGGFRGCFVADGPAGHAVLAYLWLSGRWAQAKRLFDALPDTVLDRAMNDSPHLHARVILEMRAEFAFDQTVAWLADSSRQGPVTEILHRSRRIGLAGGALDFAVLAAWDEPDLPDPLRSLGAIEPWLAGTVGEVAALAEGEADRRRERFGLSLFVRTPDDPAAHARLAGPLNPYVTPLYALTAGADGGESELERYLAGLRGRLTEIAEAHAPGLSGIEALHQRLTSAPADTVEGLSAMGLTAEWAGSFAFFHRMPDLPGVARAAERWRRTVNGLWSFGRRRPKRWRPEAAADDDSRALLRRLREAEDPAAAAERLLRLWADPSGEAGEAALRPLGQLARRFRRARVAGGNSASLALLLRSGLPGVVAAPVALLAATRVELPPQSKTEV